MVGINLISPEPQTVCRATLTHTCSNHGLGLVLGERQQVSISVMKQPVFKEF